MNPRMPLSKSASASQVIRAPLSPLSDTRTSVGAGGGVVSLTAPVLTYSIQALANASFGNQTASFGLPLNSAAGWAVSFDKGDFRGRNALVKQKEDGIPARLWGLRMQDRLIPRPHYSVTSNGEQVGETTSGTFSPTLRVGIALGYLSPRDRFSAGDDVEVEVRGRRGTAVVTKPPFVDRSPK